jgi:hypothetical protein
VDAGGSRGSLALARLPASGGKSAALAFGELTPVRSRPHSEEFQGNAAPSRTSSPKPQINISLFLFYYLSPFKTGTKFVSNASIPTIKRLEDFHR